jgi:hypothetical protein
MLLHTAAVQRYVGSVSSNVTSRRLEPLPGFELGGAIIKLAKIYFGLNDFFMHEWC